MHATTASASSCGPAVSWPARRTWPAGAAGSPPRPGPAPRGGRDARRGSRRLLRAARTGARPAPVRPGDRRPGTGPAARRRRRGAPAELARPAPAPAAGPHRRSGSAPACSSSWTAGRRARRCPRPAHGRPGGQRDGAGAQPGVHGGPTWCGRSSSTPRSGAAPGLRPDGRRHGGLVAGVGRPRPRRPAAHRARGSCRSRATRSGASGPGTRCGPRPTASSTCATRSSATSSCAMSR